MNVGNNTEAGDLEKLVADLGDFSPDVRQNARASLVAYGQAAAGPLSEALLDPRLQVRWEAAKALTELTDSAAIPNLIRTLHDADSGIRWVAAEALIAIGAPAIPPLLQALAYQKGSPESREGAHHVLHDLQNSGNQHILGPVLEALSGPAPISAVPVSALAALRKL